jgi:hypothetical protein
MGNMTIPTYEQHLRSLSNEELSDEYEEKYDEYLGTGIHDELDLVDAEWERRVQELIARRRTKIQQPNKGD